MRKAYWCFVFRRTCTGTSTIATKNGNKQVIKNAEAEILNPPQKIGKIINPNASFGNKTPMQEPGKKAEEISSPATPQGVKKAQKRKTRKRKRKAAAASSSSPETITVKEPVKDQAEKNAMVVIDAEVGNKEKIKKGRYYHQKTGKAWAVPTSDDLEQLNMVQQAYWYRIWFLRYCADNRDLEQGAWFHHNFLQDPGVESHVLIGTQLIDMYGKCRATDEAYEIFHKIQRKNVVAWNFMLGALVLRSRDEQPQGFIRMEFGFEALRLFRRMILEGLEANAITFTHAANACGSVHGLLQGKIVHQMAAAKGFDRNDTILGNALIGMYFSSKSMGKASAVFEGMKSRNEKTWTQLMTAYARVGNPRKAVILHRNMQLDGVKQDRASLVAALDACANAGDLLYGKCVHQQVFSAGLESDVFAGTAVLHMYGTCGRADIATRVFNRVRWKNVYTWNSMIAALVRSGDYVEALRCYEMMELEGIAPDRYTHVAVVDACAFLLACDYGRKVHQGVRLRPQNEFVRHALVRMYGACGRLQISRNIFRQMPYKTPENCTSVMAAYVQYGYVDVAAGIFFEMNLHGIPPVAETFTVLLDGCGHKGRLADCRRFYQSMVNDFGISPELQQFTAILHLLGRKGRLSKMRELLRNMPFHPGGGEWLTLLAASELHKDMPSGEAAAKRLIQLDPKDHVPYEILTNMYVEVNSVMKAEAVVAKMHANKMREASFVEVHGKVYRFLEGFKKQMHYEKVDEFVRRVRVRMKGAGYVFKATNVDLVRGKVEEGHHSEVLAVAFGVLRTREVEKKGRVGVRVFARHRMCSDCHAMVKFVSMVFGRKVVVKDASRFHHFEGGLCSCRDYW